jgi:chromosome segregation ATPase
VSIFFFSVFLVLSCSDVPAAEGAENAEKQVEYREQLKSYQRLKGEFDRHPVTRWKGEIAGNKKALAVLDKQLRDMIRFENEEQIEQLRQENRELRKKIGTKKKEWEALSDRLEAARKRLESLEKQIGPAVRKE